MRVGHFIKFQNYEKGFIISSKIYLAFPIASSFKKKPPHNYQSV